MVEEEKTKKKDFIEIEFTAKNLSNNEIFDTNNLEEAKRLNPKIKEVKPLIVCIGENMVVKGLDEFLEEKEIGKKYNLKLPPEKAFGKRDSKLIRLIPLKMFLAQKVYPQPGMTLALDNSLVKIVSVSGGRVLVDFNNPLAGKDIEYDIIIKKKITDMREKVSSLQNYFFNQVFDFDIENNKILFKDVKLAMILNAFKDKFKEILGLDLEILEKKSDKKESSEN